MLGLGLLELGFLRIRVEVRVCTCYGFLGLGLLGLGLLGLGFLRIRVEVRVEVRVGVRYS